VSVLAPVRPRVLSTQLIPNVPAGLHAAYKFAPGHTAAALITADQDDALYVALDEATKQAPVEVVFAQSLYAGSNHSPGPFAGECLGILGGASPEDVREGLAACVRCLEEDACFYQADEAGKLLIFPHVVSALGRYLSAEAGLPEGSAMAYLIAPPIEAVIGLDAALKAARVELQRSFAPPTNTNFGGGYLAGDLEECEAAALAFARAVVDLARAPRVL
jgi:ethanolamine utilization protein EutL